MWRQKHYVEATQANIYFIIISNDLNYITLSSEISKLRTYYSILNIVSNFD